MKAKRKKLELRPEYVRRITRIMKQKPTVHKSLDDMMKSYAEAGA